MHGENKLHLLIFTITPDESFENVNNSMCLLREVVDTVKNKSRIIDILVECGFHAFDYNACKDSVTIAIP